jgi:hypothetical protein
MMCVEWSFPLLARGPTNVAAEQAAVATSTDHFAALNDANQEIYFTCTPSELLRQIEIPPSGWAETLPFLVSLKCGSGLNGIRALEWCGNKPDSQIRGHCKHHHHQIDCGRQGKPSCLLFYSVGLVVFISLLLFISGVHHRVPSSTDPFTISTSIACLFRFRFF